MANRLKSLRRIAAVQKQMVRLSEWQLAEAERACRDLTVTQERLQGYVVEEGALGVSLAKAALRSLQAIDHKLRDAERGRESSEAALHESKRREQAVAEITERVRRQERRAEEDRDLAATIECWLAGKGTSLP